jgi:hypothetical protein
MLAAEELATAVERRTTQSEAIVQLTLRMEQPSQVSGIPKSVGMSVSKDASLGSSKLEEERLCSDEVTTRAKKHGDVVDARESARMIVPEDATTTVQRLAIQRLRLVVLAAAGQKHGDAVDAHESARVIIPKDATPTIQRLACARTVFDEHTWMCSSTRVPRDKRCAGAGENIRQIL